MGFRVLAREQALESGVGGFGFCQQRLDVREVFEP